VVTARRTPNNIYVLNEIGREGCFLGKKKWHCKRRMHHMKFGNLVKISGKEEVKEILEISKT
jgi:hypothetical protein